MTEQQSMSGKSIRETLGFMCVVASLVFVGLEIRQNTAVARGQTRQALAALNQEFMILRVTNPELTDLMTRAWSEEGIPPGSDRAQSIWVMRLILRRLENVYLQYAEGLVDESALRSYGWQGPSQFQSATFKVWWSTERAAYDPTFVSVFEERMGLTSGQARQ